jgi:hypothetical protein
VQKVHRHKGKVKAFNTGVGAPTGQRSAFQYHGHAPKIPVNQIGSGAAGATSSFNKTDVTGGAYSIGTPLNGPNVGKWRRMGVKRGF